MDLPTEFASPDLSILDAIDAIPSNINLSRISSIGEFLSAPRIVVPKRRAPVELQHGTALQLSSTIAPSAASNQGWVTVETVVIRLNTSLTPSGRFPAYWNESLPGRGEVRLGFDAAVCVQKYEPWVIEAYNTSTGSSFASRLVGKQNDSTSLSPSGIIQGARIDNIRYLNATGKSFVFSTVHNNSVDRFWEANDYQGHYSKGHCVPTPTVSPTVPPRTTILLISTYFADCFFHRRHWCSGICRTLARPVCRYPRTGRCG